MGMYKFTFQDGSEAICHYGVLGMKWGRRKDGRPQGSVGSGPAYFRGRNRVNSILSPRAKRIAKGVALGAGVAAAAYGAHRLGLDEAAVNYLKNRKSGVGGGIQRYVTNQQRILSGSRKLGEASLRKSVEINRDIRSQVASNALNVPGRVGSHADRVRANAERLAAKKTSKGQSAISKILRDGSAANAARGRSAVRSSLLSAQDYQDAVNRYASGTWKRRRRLF